MIKLLREGMHMKSLRVYVAGFWSLTCLHWTCRVGTRTPISVPATFMDVNIWASFRDTLLQAEQLAFGAPQEVRWLDFFLTGLAVCVEDERWVPWLCYEGFRLHCIRPMRRYDRLGARLGGYMQLGEKGFLQLVRPWPPAVKSFLLSNNDRPSLLLRSAMQILYMV